MNLNEVKKHVKFDMFLTTLIYIMIAVCLFLALIFTLAIPAKAASNNINSYSHSTCGSSMGSGSYYGSFQNGTCYSRAIGTTYSGKTTLVGFWLNYNFQAGKYYTFTINFKDNDLISSTIVDVVRVVDVANNRNEWSATYNFISKKQFKVYFLAPNNSSSLAISLSSGSGDPITGVSNYGISSIYLEDNDNSDEIINANNQNTQNIINNNNANSQDTQNVIVDSTNRLFESLNNMCPNLFNRFVYNENNNNLRLNNSGGFDVNGYGMSSTTSLQQFCPTCQVGSTYYLNGESDSSNKFIYIGSIWDFGTQRTLSAADLQATVLFYGEYGIDQWYHINNLIISSENKPYCAYGSSTNKIDWISSGLSALGYTEEQIKDIQEDIKDAQQQQLDYLTDDTNPNVPTSDIENVISGVEINNPLSYLLNLPLHLISKINQIFSTGTCSVVDLGSFGFASDYHFVLPCINFENYLGSSLWNTIDVFVSIGLLAFTLYKIYHAVANILTLGGEDEVSYHLGYLTPMEFLASIIGSGGFGTVVGKGRL